MKIFLYIAALSLYNLANAQDQITNAGNLKIHPGAFITFFGNFTNNGSFTDLGQEITMRGANATTIGGSSVTTFNNLTINNTFGTSPQITLSAIVIVEGTLNMTLGNINLNSNTLTIGTAATTPGTLTYTAGFVYGGTLIRWFNTTSFAIANASGHFPMGTSNGFYRPIWLAFSSNLTSGGTVSVIHNPTYPSGTVGASHVDGSWSGGTTIQGVSNSTWAVSTANGFAISGSNDGIIRFGGRGFGMYTLTDLDASLLASVVGTYGVSTNVNAPLEVNRTGLTTANISNTWRIGSKNIAASPLPVQLLSFDVKLNENIADITWSTASEYNNDFFTVERTADGINFEPVVIIEGAENSTTILNYKTVDYDPIRGISYYRLKQTDFNGAFTYSNLVEINNADNNSAFVISPNPSNGIFEVSDSENKVSKIELYNSIGEKVYQSRIDSHPIIIHASLPSGYYFLHIYIEQKIIFKKINIQ